MSLSWFSRFHPAALVLAALYTGCAQESASPDDLLADDEPTLESNDPIIGGVPAGHYPESALVSMKNGASQGYLCSGALIAPRVVLTAGHCIAGYHGFEVDLPFAGGQSATGEGLVFDYTSTGQNVDPDAHDVGLIVLDEALSISSYPLVATNKIANGTNVQNIGRIDDGVTSSSALFIGAPLAAHDAANIGFAFSYRTDEVIQSGDSGGPVVLAGTHKIVAVNSGAGNGFQVLARADLVASWIQDVVGDNGGGAHFGPALGDYEAPFPPSGDGTGDPTGASDTTLAE